MTPSGCRHLALGVGEDDQSGVLRLLRADASEQLGRNLLTGLAELVHPHGTVDSEGSIRHYVSALRVMDAALVLHVHHVGALVETNRTAVLPSSAARRAITRRFVPGQVL